MLIPLSQKPGNFHVFRMQSVRICRFTSASFATKTILDLSGWSMIMSLWNAVTFREAGHASMHLHRRHAVIRLQIKVRIVPRLRIRRLLNRRARQTITVRLQTPRLHRWTSETRANIWDRAAATVFHSKATSKIYPWTDSDLPPKRRSVQKYPHLVVTFVSMSLVLHYDSSRDR